MQRHKRGKLRPAGAFKGTCKFLPLNICQGDTKQAHVAVRNWVVVVFPMGKQRTISLDLRWVHILLSEKRPIVNISGLEDPISTLNHIFLLCLLLSIFLIIYYTSPTPLTILYKQSLVCFGFCVCAGGGRV